VSGLHYNKEIYQKEQFRLLWTPGEIRHVRVILYTPLTNLFTKLCFPIGKLSTLIMVDKAERAVLITL
jgi:hypothetical protein